MTEPKKLQTTLVSAHAVACDCDEMLLCGSFDACYHDARLAHEILPVIRQLQKELAHLVNLLHGPLEQTGEVEIPGLATLNGARAALNSAAPFLDQED